MLTTTRQREARWWFAVGGSRTRPPPHLRLENPHHAWAFEEGDSDEGEDEEEEELEEQAVVFADVVSVGRRVGKGESSSWLDGVVDSVTS